MTLEGIILRERPNLDRNLMAADEKPDSYQPPHLGGEDLGSGEPAEEVSFVHVAAHFDRARREQAQAITPVRPPIALTWRSRSRLLA